MPTRFTTHSSTIIDHVYSNDLFSDKRVCKTGLILNDIVDHCANFMFILDPNKNKNIKKSIINTSTFRNFSKKNTQTFLSFLSTTDWSPVYNSSDPNTALLHFANNFTDIHDRSDY